jgi:diketogulonate reductase-like aldo/keto reductase
MKLNDSHEIPQLGIGTFMLQPKDAEEAVLQAIADGYTLIDTANAYMNEKAVGRAVRRSGKNREDLYLSTKLWPSVYEDADNAINQTLQRLNTSYMDLLFLHQPVGNYKKAYLAMEKAVKNGRVRSLGLSNFTKEQIQELAETMEIRPAVIQCEVHPYFPQTELRTYLNTIDAKLMAWYPLGHGDASLIHETIFAELAQKYHKNNVQIILRWHLQMGNIVIPGSKDPKHIQSNRDIFDFVLSTAEMKEIASLDKNIRYYNATSEILDGYLKFTPDFDVQQ